MQRSDGSILKTWGQVHIEGRVMPWLLMGHVSLCLEDIQDIQEADQTRFPLFTFLTRVCTFILPFHLDSI